MADVAAGPFSTFVLGETPRATYPDFDRELAEEELAACLDASGKDALELQLLSTADRVSDRIDEVVIGQWKSIHGDGVDVEVDEVDEDDFARRVNLGQFEFVSWRNHGGVQPAEQIHWWLSDASAPVGEPASNFGRLRDPALDAEIRTMMTSSDPEVSTDAAHGISRILGEEAYLLWTARTVSAIVADPRVRDLATLSVPIGKRGFPVVDGSHHLAEIWCVDGDCQG